MHRLLVIRFSALGDVAMTVPTLNALALAYPDLQITVLSRQQHASLFHTLPANVCFFGADLKGRHKGTAGLRLLLDELDYRSYDAVADLHNVLRTRYLDLRLRAAGKQVAIISKNRFRRWRLTRRHLKRLTALPTVFERQLKVFRQLGFDFSLPPTLSPAYASLPLGSQHVSRQGIGIAPFAAHKGKVYPLDKMEQVVASLREQTDEQIYLFGAGREENIVLQQWAEHYPNVTNTVGHYSLDEQLQLMSTLRVMLTMDSANMHLASLVGTRVVSLWGATHPLNGFLGYGQQLSDCLGADLSCRPCSAFGNKPCRYHDYRCLSSIAPDDILKKLLEQ